jgi:hypothetical protein
VNITEEIVGLALGWVAADYDDEPEMEEILFRLCRTDFPLRMAEAVSAVAKAKAASA